MPTSGLALKIRSASFQYRARTLPIAVRRLGLLGGTVACGSVSDVKAWEMLPNRPRWLAARRPAMPTGTSASATSRAIPACRRSRSGGGRRSVAKLIARPAASSASSITNSSTPS